MGAIGGLLGVGGGANGSGFAGPQAAQITNGTNAGQIQTAYGGAQNSLQSQQALLQALQAQNGLGNQSQVYGQLQGVANGTGPNPAQAMLNQATGQNVANQAALMAGQRGASSNVGLLARQAAQQGAATQQQAVNQGASLQAQQALNALSVAGNMANTQAANQINATTANTQAQQSEQGLLQNALSAQNNAAVSNQANINNVNGQLANTNMQGQQGLIGGVLGGAGSALHLASGGEVSKYADGGPTLGVDTTLPHAQFLSAWPGASASSSQNQSSTQSNPQFTQDTTLSKGANQFAQGLVGQASNALSSSGGDVPGYSMPELGSSEGFGAVAGPSLGAGLGFSKGGNVGSKLKSGGGVPGKAKVKGNSYANDTVKALLSPGEVVIPRSVMQSADPAGGAARFVAAVMAKKRGGK